MRAAATYGRNGSSLFFLHSEASASSPSLKRELAKSTLRRLLGSTAGREEQSSRPKSIWSSRANLPNLRLGSDAPLLWRSFWREKEKARGLRTAAREAAREAARPVGCEASRGSGSALKSCCKSRREASRGCFSFLAPLALFSSSHAAGGSGRASTSARSEGR